jgi:uncharacterized protein YecT (DUF1311 family)
MKKTFILLILVFPKILFGQIPDSIVTNSQYEKYLKYKYDSIDYWLNKFYNDHIKYDSLGVLKESQRSWIKYRDFNVTLISAIKKIPYSNSEQIKFQVLFEMTDLRFSELKSIYEVSKNIRSARTAGVVTEKFFPQDIINEIPVIKFSDNQSLLVVKNIKYIIHSDPSDRTCKGCGEFKVNINILPKSTLKYIYHIIESDFLTHPYVSRNSSDEINMQNINDKVEFDLYFEPISLDFNLLTDVWKMSLMVGEIGGGKRTGFTKTHYFDKDGSIIDCEVNGYVDGSYKENDELFIKMFVCDDYQCESGTIELCKYNKAMHKIIYIKTLGRMN